MKYLKKFETLSEYESNRQILDLPNVSLITEGNDVKYNPYVDPSGGHPFVEIGGIKWATMNVGANSVTDYGLYFQWGGTQGYTASEVGSGDDKKYFYWDDYKYFTVDTTQEGDPYKNGIITKYNSIDGKTVLDASDDAVHAAWGGNWRMPTKEDFAALSAAVTTEWVNDYQGSGVNGRLMTDKTDSSKVLFFPACGYANNGSMRDVGNYGDYWSSSLYSGNVNGAYSLYFYSKNVKWGDDYNRYLGYPVRGVLGEN